MQTDNSRCSPPACFISHNVLVTGGILLSNPAGAVRGPKYVVKRGKTPVLSADQARQLLDSIDVTELSGFRDRALIGAMVYTFARVSAVTTVCRWASFANHPPPSGYVLFGRVAPRSCRI